MKITSNVTCLLALYIVGILHIMQVGSTYSYTAALNRVNCKCHADLIIQVLLSHVNTHYSRNSIFCLQMPRHNQDGFLSCRVSQLPLTPLQMCPVDRESQILFSYGGDVASKVH